MTDLMDRVALWIANGMSDCELEIRIIRLRDEHGHRYSVYRARLIIQTARGLRQAA